MKGIILAGGTGSRLYPLTEITNKHLLPVFNKPMVLYPLETLRKSGIEDILVVTGKMHAGHFINFLGSGRNYGVRLSYALQDKPAGIADALSLAEDFADGEKIAVILGDNIFKGDFSKEIQSFLRQKYGAKIFLKKVSDLERFGIPIFQGKKLLKIEEKPKRPKSPYATTGFYLYDSTVFDKIRLDKPSKRGELEITSIINMYAKEGTLSYSIIEDMWFDAGTFENLLKANIIIAKKQGFKV